jgi:hypothetical protein
VVDGALEDVGDRLDTAVGVPRKPGEIVVGVFVAKIVEQEKRVVFVCVAEAEGAAQADSRSF